MAVYADRYRLQFWDDAMPPELGYVNTQFTVLFRFPDYVGAVVDLRGSSEPVEISMEGSEEDPYGTLFPSKAKFSFAVESHWEIRNLLATDDQQIQVQIIANLGGNTLNRIVWAGWIQPTDIRESYTDKPYPGSVYAVCGLTILKNKLLLDSSGKRLTGLPTVMDAVKAGLALTNLNLPITTACNLYETQDVATGQIQNGKANQSRDPLNRARFRAEGLVINSQTIDSYSALENLLSCFNCRLAQVDGDWMIVRTIESVGGWDVWSGSSDTIMTRRYNPDYVNGSAIAKDLSVYVGRTRNVRASGDCYQWGLPIKPALAVRQDFGGYLNRLVNGDFSQYGSNKLPTGWTNQTHPTDTPECLGDGTEDSPLRLRIYGAGTNDVTDEFRTLTQRIPLPANSKTKKLTLAFKGRFRLNNVRSAMLWITAIPTDPSVGGQWVLSKSGSWTLNPKKRDMIMITLQNVYTDPVTSKQIPKAGWCNIDLAMDPVSNIKEIYVGISVAEALDGQTIDPRPYIEYADLRLEIVNTLQILDGITLMSRLDEKKKRPEPSVTFKYGDVPVAAVPSERLGSFFKEQAGEIPTTSWFRPDANIQTTPNKTLTQWALEERSKQALKPANVWEGDLVGRLPFGIFSVLKFDDITRANSQGEQVSVPHLLTKWSWKLRSQRHAVCGVEILDAPLGKPVEKSWETPDGSIPIDNDEAGNPVATNPRQIKIDPAIKLLAKGSPFSLTGTALPSHLTPLDPNDKRYQLIAEVSRGNTVLGRVLAIARVKVPFPIIPQ